MFLHHRVPRPSEPMLCRQHACRCPSTKETLLVLQGEGCECQAQQGACKKRCCCRQNGCFSQATCSVAPGSTPGEQVPSLRAWPAQIPCKELDWFGRVCLLLGKAPRRW